MALRDILIKRILQAIATVFIVLSIDFVIFHILPGDPATFLARNPNISAGAQEALIRQFGLDRPLWEQYILFLANFLVLNLGISFHYQTDVGPVLLEHLGNTLLLALPATIVAIIVGIWVGKNAAWRRGGAADALGLLFSLVTYAIPTFWLAMAMIMVFSFGLGWFPATPGLVTPGLDHTGDPIGLIIDMIGHLMLPWTVLIIAILGAFALITRNALLDVLSEDFMVTAKAKGRNEKDQLNKEAMPNAMIPITTVVALQLGFSVTGALQTEVVFSFPGIGNLIWQGVFYRDYPLLQAAFFMITIVIVAANLVADFIYYYLDPRIRVGVEFQIGEERASPREWLRSKWLPIANIIILVSVLLAFLQLVPSGSPIEGLTIGILVSMFFSAVARWKSVAWFIRTRLAPYSPANLIHAWSHNRAQILVRLSILALLLNVVVLLAAAMSGLFDLEWSVSWGMTFLGMGVFPPSGAIENGAPLSLVTSSLGHPLVTQIALAGIVLGRVVARRRSMSLTASQFFGSKMGVAGFSLVILFAGMSLFGDLIAPYDPEEFFTGGLYQSPDPTPTDHLFLLILGPMLFLGGALIWILLDRKGETPLPRYIVSIMSGALTLHIALVLGMQSWRVENIQTLLLSSVLGLVGLYLVVGNVLRHRTEVSFQGMQQHVARIVVAVVGVVGVAFIVQGTLSLVCYAPTDFPGFHIMGTDQLGRDVFSQLVIGTRVTLIVGLVATAMSVLIGTIVGLVAGYYGGVIDSLLMRFTDVFFVIPSLLLMIIMAAVLGPSIVTMILVIGIFSWTTTARIVRGQVLTIRERTYIERVRAVG